jgi:hypothetical protein
MNSASDLINIRNIGYETTFELNEFNQPRIRSELENVKDAVLFILFSKPGQYPSLPNIGLDLQGLLYSFYDEIDTNDLKQKIISQCEALGTYFDKGVIEIKKTKYKNQPSLMIHIEGTESFPSGYMKDYITESKNQYLIGITYDELNRMIYNINERSSE